MNAMKRHTFFIVDSHSLAHRAYHSAGPPLRAPDGEPTKATYIYCKILIKLLREHEPDYVAVALDTKRKWLHRRKLYPLYKRNRNKNDKDLNVQLKRMREVTKAMGLATIGAKGYEADDIIATLVDACAGLPVDVSIVSRDKDLHQLLSPEVTLRDAHTGDVFTHEDAERKWGVRVDQMIDYQTMVGDSGDNVPGVRGVGPVAAVKLLNEYGSLDNVLKNRESLPAKLAAKFDDGDAIELSKRLVTLDRDTPIDVDLEALAWRGVDVDRVRPLFRRLGFRSWSKWL